MMQRGCIRLKVMQNTKDTNEDNSDIRFESQVFIKGEYEGIIHTCDNYMMKLLLM
jgi:hypothetical protein